MTCRRLAIRHLTPAMPKSRRCSPTCPAGRWTSPGWCKGQTNYQIACELGITENTVKLYVSQVLRQTHMHNRTQLALALGNSTVRRQTTAH